MPAPIKNIDYDEVYDPNEGDNTGPQNGGGGGQPGRY